MQVLHINNTSATDFKAGKIKVMNPQIWTNEELSAFANNGEFKKIATKLKKQNKDLFASIEQLNNEAKDRIMSLFSGQNDAPENLIQKIIGPIWWSAQGDKRALVDSIVIFPQKIKDLEHKNSDEKIFSEKIKIVKDFEKKNILIKNIGDWHFSELKALQANKNFEKLTQKPELRDKPISIVKFLDIEDEWGIDIRKGDSWPYWQTLYTIRYLYDYNFSGSLAGEISRFKGINDCGLGPENKQKALDNIEKYNALQDLPKELLWKRLLNFFNSKA